MLRTMGADLTAHTIAVEAYLSRAIGACYAGAYIVSNFAEGVVDTSWQGENIFDCYRDCADKVRSDHRKGHRCHRSFQEALSLPGKYDCCSQHGQGTHHHGTLSLFFIKFPIKPGSVQLTKPLEWRYFP